MPRIMPGWVWAAAAVVLMGGGGMAGYHVADGRCEARVARMEADFSAAREAAAAESARRIAAAQAAEKKAVTALYATEKRLVDAKRRLRGALYGLPTANDCGLSAPARGLLNRTIDAGADLPARASQPNPANAAAAADSGEQTSEADLGAWIADTISAYDACRARLDAIRQWDAEVSHGG